MYIFIFVMKKIMKMKKTNANAITCLATYVILNDYRKAHDAQYNTIEKFALTINVACLFSFLSLNLDNFP